MQKRTIDTFTASHYIDQLEPYLKPGSDLSSNEYKDLIEIICDFLYIDCAIKYNNDILPYDASLTRFRAYAILKSIMESKYHSPIAGSDEIKLYWLDDDSNYVHVIAPYRACVFSQRSLEVIPQAIDEYVQCGIISPDVYDDMADTIKSMGDYEPNKSFYDLFYGNHKPDNVPRIKRLCRRISNRLKKGEHVYRGSSLLVPVIISRSLRYYYDEKTKKVGFSSLWNGLV